MVRLSALAIFGVFVLAACSTDSPSPPVASSSPSTARMVRIGQAWDAPGWRITVTGMTCGVRGDATFGENPADEVCVLHLSYTNTGSAPAPFGANLGGQFDKPTRDAVGFDAQGRTYADSAVLTNDPSVNGTNPGGSGSTDQRFPVAPGARLVRVDLAGVSLRV
jgi:hypothetical protein